MPIWSHGDEIGHLDYIMKLNRWQLPNPREQIETSLFLFHRANWDGRVLSTSRQHSIKKINDMGLARFSYEAHHPPLPYLILSFVRSILLLKKLPLALQVKIIRTICLLVFAFGLSIIYISLRRNKINNKVFYVPLGIIPLLAQDMFFSINTDVFSFLFASLAVAGLIIINKYEFSKKGWLLLAMGIILCLWTKASNVTLIAWPIFAMALLKRKTLKTLKYSILTFISVIILSIPWYIYNYLRFSNFLIDKSLPYPLISPKGISLESLNEFWLAFMRTLFRGEFFWKGGYFDPISGTLNPLL
ncbi:MAG: hypothetical protein N3B16_12085 [Candidatus Aminicenantes bacterium]|nr:hypothetical protein [Candidatus Aminicenantes bacterium]